MPEPSTEALLRLLQLASPALPIGAYSYSEGLETGVQQGLITDANSLGSWLVQELRCGAVRLEAAAIAQAHAAVTAGDWAALSGWNQWLSALREAEELRLQSWQMGRSLARLVQDLDPATAAAFDCCQPECNMAIAFAIAAAHWQIQPPEMLLGYLHSWASNLVNAGVRLIPLGQTAGQRLLLQLNPVLQATAHESLTADPKALGSCSWGAAIASMQHETLYSRLFRS